MNICKKCNTYPKRIILRNVLTVFCEKCGKKFEYHERFGNQAEKMWNNFNTMLTNSNYGKTEQKDILKV